jgi:3-oxoacyl-[acyl-carrier protein] reductase
MADERNSLMGRTVLVTGASGGIGASIVERLAAEGARPLIHYGRDKAAAEAIIARISGRGVILQADLSTAEGPFELWRKAEDAAGRIHGLINNAGIRTEPHRDIDRRRARGLEGGLAKGVSGEFLRRGRSLQGGTEALQSAWRRADHQHGEPRRPARLYGRCDALWRNEGGAREPHEIDCSQFRPRGRRCRHVAPGWVRTDMAEDFVAEHGKEAAVADIPIGEMAEPSEVAELVAFLLRPSQSSLNGATLDVNGGSYIR